MQETSMEPMPNLNEINADKNSSVNYNALITEVRKMRTLSLEEKESVLDVIAEIMGYQHTTESSLSEDIPVDKQLKPLESETAKVIDKDGKKVLEVSANGRVFEIRGYKVDQPNGTIVIRYKLTTDGQLEPIQGIGSKGNKFGHTKEKIIEKLRSYVGSNAEKIIQSFLEYDATFYGS